MKILWVKSDFLHPTDRGGQIRTLGMLRALHRHHEIQYVCLDQGLNPEGPARASEYCSSAEAILHQVPPRGTPRFFLQLLANLFSPLPIAVSRYRSSEMKRFLAERLRRESFDAVVCDFLFPFPNLPDAENAVLFEHNVETTIWRRHAAHASNVVSRWYYNLQAQRMFRIEQEACRAARHVIAVSDVDEQQIRSEFGVSSVSSIPTGVDIDYFARPQLVEPKTDLVFLGSMDWLPNVDGALFFLKEIYPLILQAKPTCRVALVGRRPDPSLVRAASQFPSAVVTGTIADVRPWLWGAKASVVPLRIGGGTRLKIYEAMAGGVPVISTLVGAEGLPVTDETCLLSRNDPASFAAACLELLADAERSKTLADSALAMVRERFSWDAVALEFQAILEHASTPLAAHARQ